jgi:hypothetical protein
MATVQTLTLLDLVQTLNEFAQTDDEVVAVVTQLVNSGQVRLGGNFTGARINLSTPASLAKYPTDSSRLDPSKSPSPPST